jgi:hypothetical protein
MLVRIHGGYGEVHLANQVTEIPDRRSSPIAKTLQALWAFGSSRIITSAVPRSPNNSDPCFA